MKKRKTDYLMLLPGIGYILIFIVFAFISMAAQSVGFFNYTGESAFSLEFWKNIFTKSFIDDLLYSIKIAFLTAFISIILCYPLSLFLQKIPEAKDDFIVNQNTAVCSGAGSGFPDYKYY